MKRAIIYCALAACQIALNGFSTLNEHSASADPVKNIEQGKVFTIAGNGSGGFNGDENPALQAKLSSPYDVAVRKDGSYYIMDHGNSRVRLVDPLGVIHTVAGAGKDGFNGDNIPATEAQLNRPYGLCLDADENLYIADTYNNRIRKVDSNGIITTIAGTGDGGFGGDGGPALKAQFNTPFGIFIDQTGTLYIADTGNHRVRMVTREGIITTLAGNGEVGFTGDGSPAIACRLNNPLSVYTDAAKNVFIADAGSHVIRKIGASGLISTVAGNGQPGHSGDGGPATQARLHKPSGITKDKEGNLLITDAENHVIRLVNQFGTISSYAGSGEEGYSEDGVSPGQAKFKRPSRVFVTANDDAYVADMHNHRVRLITSSIPLKIVAGDDRVAFVDEPTTLKSQVEGGSGSYLLNWSILSGPDTSLGQFSSTTIKDPVFTPTKAGVYVLVFMVDDQVRPPQGDTVTLLVFNPIPIDTVPICDTLLTMDDLSGLTDYDVADQRDLIIRWRLDTVKINPNDVSDINVFVSVDGEDYEFLGGTGNGTAMLLEWKPTQSDFFNPKFFEGPQFGHTYQFRLFVSTRSGNPVYYGPFDTKGAVSYQELILPTPIPDTPTPVITNTPTDTPEPPVSTPTFTPKPVNTPTDTPVPTDAPTVKPSPTKAQPTNTKVPVNTPTFTPSITATNKPVATVTPLQTATFTNTPSATAKPSPTNTPANPSTPTKTATSNPTILATPTRTPTWTPTNTATPTSTPVPGDPIIRVDPLSLSFTRVSASGGDVNAQPAEVRSYAQTVNTDWRILLRSGEINPENSSTNAMKPASIVLNKKNTSRHVLVQFNQIPTQQEQNELARQGVRLLRYIPRMAYWASVDTSAPGLSAQSGKGGNIRWMAESPQVNRLSPEASSNLYPQNAWMDDGRVQVLALFFNDVAQADAKQTIEQASGELLEWLGAHLAKIAIRTENLSALANQDSVEWVEPVPAPNEPVNAVASSRIRTTPLRSVPYSLNGKNVTVGVWDAGQVDTHPDFGSRLTVVDTAYPVHYHSTHVAGTIGGNAASGQTGALGMAPSVFIRSYDWDYDSTEMRSGYAAGVRLSNHSYGEIIGNFWNSNKNAWDFWANTYRFGMYATSSAEFDQVVYDTGLVVFKAAGNDRGEGDGPYDCIEPRGVAKNVISIGATSDEDDMSTFSSWGPADDGRVKPDLCANGTGLYSTMPGGDYASLSGTSMASPSACGAGALLVQLYQQEMSAEPKAATLKALMIHGAADLGRTGPDYIYGWGLIDAKSSADLLIGRMWREGTVTTGMYVPYTVVMPSGANNLKVTLVWTDPAASPSAAKALVNDLDLILRSPSGIPYYPWKLDKANPSANATTGANTVDNVEQVAINNPEAGVWTIEVHGTAVTLGAGNYAVVTEAFGNVDDSQSFRIYNDGDGTLNVTSMSVTDGAWVDYSPKAPFSVAPSQYQKVNVWVNYDQAPYGENTRQISIGSNDSAGNNPYPDGVYVTVNNNVTPTPVPTNTPVSTPTSTPVPAATPTSAPPSIQITPLQLDFVYSGRTMGLNEAKTVTHSNNPTVNKTMDPSSEEEAGFDTAAMLPDGRILVWSTFAPGTNLLALRQQIEARGDKVISLVPEGRLLLAVLPQNLISLSSVNGVQDIAPAPPRTDSIQDLPTLDQPLLGALQPSEEEQQRIDQSFAKTDSLQPNDLSILRANLEGQAQSPSAADNTLSQYFPPIRSQGGQGSCTCWAAAYYYNTFTQAKDEGYNVSTGNNDFICSPGFLYPLVNGGTDSGAYTAYAMSRLSDIGCSSWTEKPYSDKDYSSWPTEQVWLGALKNRTSVNHLIYSDVATLKQHLANGNLAVTQTPVYMNWYYWSDNKEGISNGVLYAPAGNLVGYHALTIVGYDDNRAYTGGKGAFLIANSWGQWGTYNSSGSGSRGFMWVSYDYFMQDFRYGWYNDDRDNYRPRLYSAAGMNHPDRLQVEYRGGIGEPTAPVWESRQTLDGTYYKPYGYPFTLSSVNRVVVDLSDGINQIPDMGNIQLYVQSLLPNTSGQPLTTVEFFHDFDGNGAFDSVSATGSGLSTTGNGLWYGQVNFNGSNDTSSFTISNQGGSDLTIASIALDQEEAAISWTPQAPFTVAAGKSQTVSVKIDWDQLSLGQFTRQLLVESNDSAKSPYPNGVYINVNKDVEPTPTPTATNTPTNTSTPMATWTPTHTPTRTNTPLTTPTYTPQPVPTNTPKNTSTPIPSEPTATRTPTGKPSTPTNTPIATPTGLAATPTKPASTPTATTTATLKPGEPTPTATPTVTPTPVVEPTIPPTPQPTILADYRFEPLTETLESLGFTSIPETARVQVAAIPTDPNEPNATNGVGLKIIISPGETITINGLEIPILLQPNQITQWLSPSSNDIQVAVGVYAQRENQSGAVGFTWMSAPEIAAFEWRQALVEIEAGYTSVIPFLMLHNKGVQDQTVYVDNLTILQGKAGTKGESIALDPWQANLWLPEADSGNAYLEGTALVLDKPAGKLASRFGAVYTPASYPHRFDVEIDVVKTQGTTGNLTLWTGSGARSFQTDIPLWMLQSGVSTTVKLSGIVKEDIGSLLLIVQTAGEDAETVRVNSVRVNQRQ